MMEEILKDAYEKGRRWDEEVWPREKRVKEEDSWRGIASFCGAPSLARLAAASVGLYRATRDIVPGLLEGTRLYPHQVNALSFMLRRERQGGGLFCDEPGLGKSLVCVCLALKTAKLRAVGKSSVDLERRRRAAAVPGLRSAGRDNVRPETLGGTLIVAPGTLVSHWKSEVSRFAPGLVDDDEVTVCSRERLSAEFGAERDAQYFGRDAYRSPLSSTAWLRVVVDEGQHLGGSCESNTALMLDRLTAQRKWIVTGTPTTKRGGGEAAVKQLRRLLAAVGCPARSGLASATREAVVRHAASDIRLPVPVKQVVRLEASVAETRSLNAFVSFIMTNLLCTKMEVSDERSMRDGFEVSLANPKNRRQALDAIRNILLCCAGGGEMVLDAGPGVVEELEFLLLKVHGADPRRVSELRPCDSCGVELAYLLVTPCCHLVCPECVRPHHKACVACGKPFSDVSYLASDDAYEHAVEVIGDDDPPPPPSGTVSATHQLRCRHWHGWATRHDARSRRCDKQHAKWRTKVMDGVEAFVWLQPGVELRWREALLETDADARALALWRRRDWGRDEEHESLRTLAEIKRRDTLDQHSKASHVLARLDAAVRSRDDPRPVRAIVFAEDRKVLDFVGHYLVLRLGEDAVQQHWGRARGEELAKFATGLAVGWRCPRCRHWNDDSSRACARRFVHARVSGERFSVPEDHVEGHYVGRVYRVGEPVVVPYNNNSEVRANVEVVKRCGIKRTSRRAERRQLPDAARAIGATHPVQVDYLIMADTPEDVLYETSRNRNLNADDAAKIDAVLRRLELKRQAAPANLLLPRRRMRMVPDFVVRGDGNSPDSLRTSPSPSPSSFYAGACF
ncbi:hypothetical protein CTAYLR_003122 [Chrysophaeum taylorii]|uniref:Helicase ATP-binding domain-containing protein n=1 Tax=Chrysophaeum taylorii TaxID=2483200 RepID=A0AAD7XUC8_9STRA|nr:hypothetical protein CTAYLR_003122 [Chrysophaeum taylorii]